MSKIFSHVENEIEMSSSMEDFDLVSRISLDNHQQNDDEKHVQRTTNHDDQSPDISSPQETNRKLSADESTTSPQFTSLIDFIPSDKNLKVSAKLNKNKTKFDPSS